MDLVNITNILAQLSIQTAQKDEALNDFFLVIISIIIFFMQCGFAFLEAGSVRSKNVTNILIKNILDSFIGGLSYYLIGYALGFGNPGNFFCGDKYWALSHLPSTKYSHVLFHFAFAATAATIVSGAVAERCEFTTYLFYTVFITGFLYPIVTHWAWTENGWLAKGYSLVMSDNTTLQSSYMDFAGSGVVHVVGGSAAFIAAVILQPRIGRFDSSTGASKSIKGHSIPLVSLGGFILFFGFFAFNGGSQASISNAGDGQVVALAMVNTLMSGSGAAFTTMVLTRLRGTTWSLLQTINGALAGMVAICAGCNIVYPWGALVIGVFAGVSYLIWSWFMESLKIDDPLDAVAVHFGGGFWGVISVAFLHMERGIVMKFDRQSGFDLAWQLVGVCAITAWSAGVTLLLFGFTKAIGIFRVSKEWEEKGLDIPKHGEPAYPLLAYGHGWGDAPPELSMAGLEQSRVSALHNERNLPTVAMEINHAYPNNAFNP